MTGPDVHTCPVTGRVVIVAPARGLRPMAVEPGDSFCPFCPGNEHDTPEELFALPAAPAPWRVRVVKNKFPAVGAEPGPAFGFHEVVIEGRAHEPDPADLPPDVYADLFRAYRERTRIHAADPRIRHVMAFKNAGRDAGASLAHAHSQILATAFVPPDVLAARAAAAAYHARTGLCPACDILTSAPEVAGTANFVAVCPPAPRFGYETWVLPRRHATRFEDVSAAACGELGGLVRRVVRATAAVLHGPAVNWFVTTGGPPASAHWAVHVFPRTAVPAGYEWATGVFINTVPPAVAAARLREALEGEPGA